MRPQEGRRGGEGDGWLTGNLLKSVSMLLGNMAVEHVFQKHSPLTLELLILQDFFFRLSPPGRGPAAVLVLDGRHGNRYGNGG